MTLSIIIVGKNSNKTLKRCIDCLKLALDNSSQFIKQYEIIYIDSNSSDDSVLISKSSNIDVIEITEGFTTASLGRYLGLKYAKYDNLLFVDSDMDLDENWFNNSFDLFKRYGAIIGERHEKLYKNDKVIKEVSRFYNIKEVGVASNIGGFLMINKGVVEDINYTPIIKNEEEKDFYAKFYDKNKIYRVPISAYVHNNYNLTTSRIREYLMPYAKNGYILSLVSSIKNKYFINYISLQRKYIISMMVSVVFYLSLLSGNHIFIFTLVLLLINGGRQMKGSIMTTLFFPYKLIMSLMLMIKKRVIKYKYKNKEYILEIKI